VAAYRCQDFYTVFSSYGFTVVPVFILMGLIGASAGVSRTLPSGKQVESAIFQVAFAIGTIVAATAFKANMRVDSGTVATFSANCHSEMDKYRLRQTALDGNRSQCWHAWSLIPQCWTCYLWPHHGNLDRQIIPRRHHPGPHLRLTFALTLVFWCRFRRYGPAGKRFSWKDRFAALPLPSPFYVYS